MSEKHEERDATRCQQSPAPDPYGAGKATDKRAAEQQHCRDGVCITAQMNVSCHNREQERGGVEGRRIRFQLRTHSLETLRPSGA
jgi:hypothetical protein